MEQEYIGKMLLKYPWILSTSVIENYTQMLLLFNRKKVTGKRIFLLCPTWWRKILFDIVFLLLLLEVVSQVFAFRFPVQPLVLLWKAGLIFWVVQQKEWTQFWSCLMIWVSVRKCWFQLLHQVHSCCWENLMSFRRCVTILMVCFPYINSIGNGEIYFA